MFSAVMPVVGYVVAGLLGCFPNWQQLLHGLARAVRPVGTDSAASGSVGRMLVDVGADACFRRTRTLERALRFEQ
jgi:hypothetical protein